MTDNNHFDPIYNDFPSVSIDNSPSVLLLTAAENTAICWNKTSCCNGSKSAAFAHQQFVFSPNFSLMPYTLSGFQFLETFFLTSSTTLPCHALRVWL